MEEDEHLRDTIGVMLHAITGYCASFEQARALKPELGLEDIRLPSMKGAKSVIELHAADVSSGILL